MVSEGSYQRHSVSDEHVASHILTPFTPSWLQVGYSSVSNVIVFNASTHIRHVEVVCTKHLPKKLAGTLERPAHYVRKNAVSIAACTAYRSVKGVSACTRWHTTIRRCLDSSASESA